MTQKRVHIPAEKMIVGHDESVSQVSLSGISIIHDQKENSGNSTASKDVISKQMDDKLPMPDLERNKIDDEVNQTGVHDMSNIKLRNHQDPLPDTPDKDKPKVT